MSPLLTWGSTTLLLVAASLGLSLVDNASDPEAPTSMTEALPPLDSTGGEHESFDLLTTIHGHLDFDLPEHATGWATATLAPLDSTPVRSDRSLCIKLVRLEPSPVTLRQSGQCGMNVNVQSNLDFGDQTVFETDLAELDPGQYRLEFEADPQAATLQFVVAWEIAQ